MTDLKTLFEISSKEHSHLCPRQILGVRMGLFGMRTIGFDEPPAKKRLLVIVETDGCFVDGISAATACTIGHRTMRVEDYGKPAAVFVDTVNSLAVRVSPALNIRSKAYNYALGESRHYFAQMQAYQIMPDEEMFTVRTVMLKTPVAAILSRHGLRVNCANCGEEIINEREVKVGELTLCKTCADGGYYTEYVSSSHALFSRSMVAVPTLLNPSDD